MKDRLDSPIDYLNQIVTNYLDESGSAAENYIEQLSLTEKLIRLVERNDFEGVEVWLNTIPGDPERFGSAFCQVYSLAQELCLRHG